MKKVISTSSATSEKVGPFDIVRALPNRSTGSVGPVVFLDHMPEKYYPPGELPETDGSFAHPHRGIATFTYLVKGELDHLDSHSGHGIVKAGGVQWMNSGNGIIHDEGFPKGLRDQGGTFYSFQFWVNLPADIKAKAPEYMPVQSDQLPLIQLADNTGTLKVLLGEFDSQLSPIPTYTQQFIWHVSLEAGKSIELNTHKEHDVGGYLPESKAVISGKTISQREFFLFENKKNKLKIENPQNHAIDILLFGGEPYAEPVAAHGPFIMNNMEEIRTAYSDFHAGKYGNINYDIPEL